MNMHKSYRVQELAEKLYAELRAQGIEVLMDDRKERPGVMFADMELIGIPHTIVLGDRNLDNDDIEYKYRRNGEKELIKTGDIVDFWSKPLKANTNKKALMIRAFFLSINYTLYQNKFRVFIRHQRFHFLTRIRV